MTILNINNSIKYINNRFIGKLANSTIKYQKSSFYILEQNNIAKRINRILLNKVKVLSYNSYLPLEFQRDIIYTIVYLYNRTFNSFINYKILY